MNDAYISRLCINITEDIIGKTIECATDTGNVTGRRNVTVTTGNAEHGLVISHVPTQILTKLCCVDNGYIYNYYYSSASLSTFSYSSISTSKQCQTTLH